MGLPEILINFTKRAASLIKRSQRGIACIIVKDDTDKSFTFKKYKFSTDIETTKFTAKNVEYIKDVFLSGPFEVLVVRIDIAGTFADSAAILDKLKYNWVGFMAATEQQELATYIKAKNAVNKARQIKGIVYKATITDDKHIVNFTNGKIKKVGKAEEDGWGYIARLVGIFAAMPLDQSGTYFLLPDLESVTEPEDVNQAIDKGELIIINDDGEPKIGRAVNSLQTLSATVTEDMKKIVIVEAMDLIQEDIYAEFKNNYVRKFKNRYDNQALFISAVNGYFKGLTKEDVLDPNFENKSFVDVDAQRDMHIAMGKVEAEEWTEFEVKKNTIGSKVLLAGNIKITDAMEDLTFNIELA